MNNIFTIKNDVLQISVKETGAELCSIIRLSDNKEYMWDGNPAVWKGQAPVLFPIIGALKEGVFIHKGKEYSLPKHGFFRNNSLVKLVKRSKNSISFKLKFSSDTLKVYPFQFEFLITFTLDGNKILTTHKVINHGENTMYFSVGGHPAFKCPLESGEQYNDYYLEFEDLETANTFPIDSNDLIGLKGDLILNQNKRIDLDYAMFKNGALVFKDLKSQHVSLVSKKSGKHIDVSLKGFPFLGIWAMPNADYVCIEPWIGVNDDINCDQQIETKEGIVALDARKHFEAEYTIELF